MQGLSYNNEEHTAPIDGVGATTFPSPSQEAAVIDLLEFKHENILAWLTLLRSLQQGYQHLSSSQILSSRQIEALTLLKDSPDVLVLQWLRTSRYTGERWRKTSLRAETHMAIEMAENVGALPRDGLYDAPPHATSALSFSRQCSSNSIPGSSGSSLGPLTYYSRNSSSETPMTSTSQGDLSFHFSRRTSNSMIGAPSAIPTSGTHSHWCIVCENPKAMTTCDGWKRHMKEHEVIFPCMPQGPVQASDLGPQCNLCGSFSPDQEHLDAHSVQQCVTKCRTYTRKANLVKHLEEVHSIQDGSGLAEAWRIAFKKRYFSCGFCIILFDNINDQLNHIDIDHFRRLEDICNWDMTKVIKGLLLQSGVDMAWHAIAASYAQSGFSWETSCNRDLQLRLELSEEAPDTLAAAVFNSCIYDWSHHNYDDSGLTMGHSIHPLVTSTPMQPLRTADRDSHSTSGFTPTVISESQQPNIPVLDEINSDPSVSYLPLPPPMFEASSEPIISGHQPIHVGERRLKASNNVENATSAHKLPTSNIGVTLTEDRRTRYETWGQGPSHHLIMNPEMPGVADLPTDQTDTQSSGKGSAGPGGSERSSQPTKVFSSHNSTMNAWREKPPSIVSQLKKKFSSHRSKDQVPDPQISMDIDLDGLMSFMEEEEHTRFVRRVGSHSD